MALEFYRNSHAAANKVDDGVFVEIHKECRLFDQQFKLGSTLCMTFTVKVSKGGFGTFDKILVYEGNTKKHVLYTDSVDTSEDLYDTYVLCDSMLKFNKIYDGSTLTNYGQTAVTYKQIIADICSQVGVSVNTTSYKGANNTTTIYDNVTPARNHIAWFAELNSGYAYISSQDKLEFERYGNGLSNIINVEDCSSFKVGEVHEYGSIVFDNLDMHFEASTGLPGEPPLYLDPNNRYIIQQSDVDRINQYFGVANFYSIKVEKCPILDVPAGEFVTFSLNGHLYSTIVQIDQDYVLGWQGGYECWVDNAEQIETQIISTEQKMRLMQVKYDAELNEFSRSISDLAENTTATITHTADTIREDFDREIEIIKDDVTKVAVVTTYIQRTAEGLEIGLKSDDEDVDTTIRMQLTNESLNFLNNDDEILASLDANEGLVASKLAVGSPTEGDKRWQFIVWGDNNTHLRIAKHT